MKYSRTIVVDAIPCTIVRQAMVEQTELPPWFTQAVSLVTVVPDGVHIQMANGSLLAGMDDMIILDAVGDIYACKADKFLRNYTPVAE